MTKCLTYRRWLARRHSAVEGDSGATKLANAHTAVVAACLFRSFIAFPCHGLLQASQIGGWFVHIGRLLPVWTKVSKLLAIVTFGNLCVSLQLLSRALDNNLLESVDIVHGSSWLRLFQIWSRYFLSGLFLRFLDYS